MLAPASEDELLDRAWARLGASTQQAHDDMVALLALPGEDPKTAEETELYYFAALILRSQDRLDDVLASSNPRLHKYELIWTALDPYLRKHGYNLRSRYAVGGTGHDSVHDEDAPSEDMDSPTLTERTMRANYSASDRRVVLKIVCTHEEALGGEELEILQYLNQSPLRTQPENRAVQLLDVVDFPSPPGGENLAPHYRIIVIPALVALPWTYPDDSGSDVALELMRQTFAAVAFLHSHDICHRDIGPGNFMVSGTTAPLQLHVIDFGRSFRVPVAGGTHLASTRGPWIGGQVDVMPESMYEAKTLHNPFSADVSALAQTWDMLFNIASCTQSAEIRRLLKRMMNRNPNKRPTAAKASHDLESIMETSAEVLYGPGATSATSSREASAAGAVPRSSLSVHDRNDA